MTTVRRTKKTKTMVRTATKERKTTMRKRARRNTAKWKRRQRRRRSWRRKKKKKMMMRRRRTTTSGPHGKSTAKVRASTRRKSSRTNFAGITSKSLRASVIFWGGVRPIDLERKEDEYPKLVEECMVFAIKQHNEEKGVNLHLHRILMANLGGAG